MDELIQHIIGSTGFMYGVAALLALIPVFGWMYFFIHKNDHESKYMLSVFLMGTLTVLPIIWLYRFVDVRFEWAGAGMLGLLVSALPFIFRGMIEEVIKGSLIYYIDFSAIQIKTINNCIKYNILVGLGFAFSENIIFFFRGLESGDFAAFFEIFVFRSIFTVCMHAIFSSLMGYYYGLAKFSDPIVRQQKWEGKTHDFVRWWSHKVGKDPRSILPRIKLVFGFLIASILHGLYNFALVSEYIWAAFLVLGLGFVYVKYLSNRKAGNLVLAMTGAKRPSLMAPRDEEVVLELLGMWMNEGKYQEVSEICTRLLERDPDNRVVKLFQAKAEDRKKLKGSVKKISELFGKAQ